MMIILYFIIYFYLLYCSENDLLANLGIERYDPQANQLNGKVTKLFSFPCIKSKPIRLVVYSLKVKDMQHELFFNFKSETSNSISINEEIGSIVSTLYNFMFLEIV